MDWQEFILWASICVALLSLGALVLLVTLYWRNESRQRAQYDRAKADLADTAMLFQTMRDVVRQQKELAKSFNTDLESKIGAVKLVLARSLEKNEKLYERQRVLMSELEEAKAQLHSLHQQLAKAQIGGIRPPKPSPPRAAQELAALAADFDRTPEPAPQPSADALRGTGITKQPHVAWSGDPLEAPLPFETPVPVPASAAQPAVPPPAAPAPAPEPAVVAEDPQAARQAFRALLNLEAQDTAGAHVNGSPEVPPLQHRVVEYRRAGMPIADIARELGIGRGEVRLMLSLANESGSE